ncbi:MAG: cobalamin-binding protein [Thermoplasmata archaeon]
MRVVSLLPSATEIVAALGHAGDLVGRSAECDYPPEIRSRRVVMRPKVDDFEKDSASIDARVREVRSRDESLYAIDLDALRSLRPDLLLTQDLCSVCSVTEHEVVRACARSGVSPRIVSLRPTRLGEVWESVRTVARALGDEPAADRLLESVGVRASAAPPSGRRVAVVEWVDPPIVAGLWTPDIVACAGGLPYGAVPGKPGERTRWDTIVRDAPDLVVLSPCSFSVDRCRLEIARSDAGPALDSLASSGEVVLADEAYFSRPGPRLADGVGLIRRLLEGGPCTGPMPVRRWEHGEEVIP